MRFFREWVSQLCVLFSRNNMTILDWAAWRWHCQHQSHNWNNRHILFAKRQCHPSETKPQHYIIKVRARFGCLSKTTKMRETRRCSWLKREFIYSHRAYYYIAVSSLIFLIEIQFVIYTMYNVNALYFQLTERNQSCTPFKLSLKSRFNPFVVSLSKMSVFCEQKVDFQVRSWLFSDWKSIKSWFSKQKVNKKNRFMKSNF